MRWTLEQLRTFRTVVRDGSLAAAAAELGYTPGAISQQLTTLERAVGARLLVRDRRGVTLTDAGANLLPAVEAVLAAEQRARQTLNDDDPVTEVRLGVFGSIAVESVGTATVELARSSPGVRLRAVEVDVEVMPAAVLEDRVDVALGLRYRGAPLPPQRGLEAVGLAREPFGVVTSTALGPAADLDAMNWILPPATSSFGRAARMACMNMGVEPSAAHIVTDTAVSLALAAAGHGATIATPLMMRMRPDARGLLWSELADDREIVAFVRSGMMQRDSIRSVIDALRTAFLQLTR